MRGESTISPEMTGKLVSAFQALQRRRRRRRAGRRTPTPIAQPVAARAARSCADIARGASNKEIARALDIAETTVKIHVQHILRKLKLSSRVQAAVYAAARTG